MGSWSAEAAAVLAGSARGSAVLTRRLLLLGFCVFLCVWVQDGNEEEGKKRRDRDRRQNKCCFLS